MILHQEVETNILYFNCLSSTFNFLAPSGCLQYYMEPSGSVRGFNYAPSSNGNPNSIGVQGSRQIASLNYGACVRMAPGQCTITWAIVSTYISQ